MNERMSPIGTQVNPVVGQEPGDGDFRTNCIACNEYDKLLLTFCMHDPGGSRSPGQFGRMAAKDLQPARPFLLCVIKIRAIGIVFVSIHRMWRKFRISRKPELQSRSRNISICRW